jgi:hypothetical protein
MSSRNRQQYITASRTKNLCQFRQKFFPQTLSHFELSYVFLEFTSCDINSSSRKQDSRKNWKGYIGMPGVETLFLVGIDGSARAYTPLRLVCVLPVFTKPLSLSLGSQAPANSSFVILAEIAIKLPERRRSVPRLEIPH